MDYDVVVAGAGPTGAAAARDIARRHFKVLLVEEHDSVGEPSYCSGLVTPRTIDLVGISDGIVLNALRGATVHSASGKELSLGGDSVRALAIDRVAFDRVLAEQAQQAGAELLLRTRLLHTERRNGGLSLGVDVRGRRLSITTKLLIGADGARSFVARWLNGSAPGEVVTAVGAEAELRTEAADTVEIFVGESIAPGWFGWIIPLGDGHARVGIGNGSSDGKPPRQLLQDLTTAFPRSFNGAKLGELRGHVLPLYSPTRTFGDNVLLVGDAARQVKPTTGGGIYTGLVGAKHCAVTAVEALEKGDLSERFLSKYERGWKEEIGAELKRGVDLRKVFCSLSDRDIDNLLTQLSSPTFRAMINRLGDIDFPSSLFGELLKAAPFLGGFVRVALSFPWHWPPLGQR